MTVIAAVHTPQGIFMGADQGGSDPHGTTTTTMPKVFFSAETNMLIGVTASYRLLQLLQHVWTPPSADWAPATITEAIFRTYHDWHPLFRAHQVIETINGVDRLHNEAAIMVATPHLLFLLQSDFSIIPAHEGYFACGAGEQFAMGALNATKDHPPQRRVRCALEAAIAHSCYCHYPYTIQGIHPQPQPENPL